ncbi:MAG: ERG4/ERG24 ergosterol biosynthesis protein [Candidatus Bathyarchaeota archaeon B23]|nr:MAG: ERG4/ERG24 ergosterol biosynthesis protein [Candidatus Bathyarchaeota archaeon B23]
MMKRDDRGNMLKRYLLMNPGKRAVMEWGILGLSTFLSFYFSILPIPFSKYFLGIGILLFIVGGLVHGLSHKYHKQAHDSSDEIEQIITYGIYSKIRHPGYLGIILS